MNCIKCGQEENTIIIDMTGYCTNCINFMSDIELRKMTLDLLNKEPEPQILKVQFFEGRDLVQIKDQMNRLFEQEKLTKDRLVKIEYSQELDRTKYEKIIDYHVMVLYE